MLDEHSGIWQNIGMGGLRETFRAGISMALLVASGACATEGEQAAPETSRPTPGAEDRRPAVDGILAQVVEMELSINEIAIATKGLHSGDCPSLLQVVREGSGKERAAALAVLRAMGERARSTVPDLLALVRRANQEGEEDLLGDCLSTLQTLKPTPEEVGPVLLEELKRTRSAWARHLIGDELVWFGVGGAEVLALIGPDLWAEDGTARAFAADTLSWCDPPASPEGDYLRERALEMAVGDPEDSARFLAADLARKWTVEASRGRGSLFKMIRRPHEASDPDIWESTDEHVALALGSALRGDLDPILSELEACIASGDPVLRARAILVLACVRFEKLRHIEAVLDHILQASRDMDPRVVNAAEQADRILEARAMPEDEGE